MWRITLALAALSLSPVVACAEGKAVVSAAAQPAPKTAVPADCQAGIASAMKRTYALPPSAGRAALLEQIQRADVARHEDDKDDCAEQLAAATAVLDQIDAAKKAAEPPPEAQPKGAAKP